MARILIFGDIHYSKNSLPEEKRWYPELVSFLEFFSERLARKFLRFCDNYSQRHFKNFIEYLKNINDEYDVAICLGDMTSGAMESGLITEKARQEAIELKEKLKSVIKSPLHFVFGNHDLGYFAPIGYKKGGASIESLRLASRIYGAKPFYSFEIHDRKFIILGDALMARNKGNGEMKKLKEEQFEFLKKELESDEEFFIFIHSPFALYNKEFQKIIRKNYGKIKGIVCGHAHSSLIKHFVAPAFPFSKKLVIIPSVIGFFGFMGFTRGFTELTLSNPSYKWEHKKF